MNSVRGSDLALNTPLPGYSTLTQRAPTTGALRGTLKRVVTHEAALVVAVVMAPVAIALLAAF